MARIAGPERILRMAERARRRREAPAFAAVDGARPFIHEHFTPLYHTPCYRELSDAQRLRYNQLAGIQYNEHFAAFELGFTSRIMDGLARGRMLRERPHLSRCLVIMLEEEADHRAMFLALNRLCLPAVYEHTSSHFTRLGPLENGVMRLATALPGQLMFLVWFVLVAEEFSVRLGRAMVKRPDTESLGPLEENFRRIHALHLRDEARHVHIDGQVIQACLDGASGFKRRLNASLYRPLLREIATPKRAAVAVVRHLVAEHPELAPARARLVDAVRSAPAREAMFALMTEEAGAPITAELLRHYPEFRPREATAGA